MAPRGGGPGLHLVERGAHGPALVFLHYFAGSARAWDGVVARLAGGYRCVAVDLRGHGASAAPRDDHTLADGADDVAAAIDRLAIGAYALVGHSMGGKIALALAARRPPGLGAVVLVAPSPPTPEPMTGAERERLLAAHGDRVEAAETARRIVARPLAPAARERVIEDNLRTAPSAWRAWLERGSREDVSAAMRGVAVPTLVLAGAADPVIPPELLAREVVARVRGARLVTLPGVGHLVPLEAPAAVAGAIRAHWPARASHGTPR